MLGLNHSPPSSSAALWTETAWWAERKFWLGMACSVLFLFLAFRKVQWAELGAALRAVDWRYLLLATGVFLLKQVARGFRWQVLLAPLGPLQVREAFAYLNIGQMANNLLPLRAGEVVRTVLLGEKKKFSKGAVLATIILERLLDILVLVGLAVLLMLAMPIPPLVKHSILAFGSGAGLVMAGLWWAAGRLAPADMQGPGESSESKRTASLGGTRLMRLVQKVHRLGYSFTSGLAVVRSPGQAGAAVSYSALTWGLAGGFAWLVLQACHLDLPWTAAFLVIVLTNLGSAIPSSPGFIGVVHFLAVVALEPWAVERSAALGFAIVLHALSFLISVGLGVVSWGLERKSFGAHSRQRLALGAGQDKVGSASIG